MIANATAPIFLTITAEQFHIATSGGQPHAIVVAWNGCKVADHDYVISIISIISVISLIFSRVAAAPHKADDRVVGVADINPLEAFPTAINAMKGRLALIEMVEIGHKTLQLL